MTSLLLASLFAIHAIADETQHPESSPREIALAYLSDWNPSSARLEPEAMHDVLAAFARRFVVGDAESSSTRFPRGEWSARLISRLEASTQKPLGDDRVRDYVLEFMRRYEPEFRAAFEAAREYQSLEASWTGVRPLATVEPLTPAHLAGGCALVLATFGTTLGGGLATAWAYDNPYGAAAGLAPLALYAAGRRAFYELREPRLRRRARRAWPAFRDLTECLKEFATSTEAYAEGRF